MIFKYDPEKELDIFNRMAKDGKFGPEKTTLLWAKEFGQVKFENNCSFLSAHISLCEENWKEVETNFLSNMSKFFEKDCVIPDEMTCYLVRYTTFPYSINYNWFNAPLFGNPSERNRVIMHELCHFFTPEGIGRSLKEALPVILNDYEGFNMFAADRGHLTDIEEMRLRPLILEQFNTGKTYSQILKTIHPDSK